jgi:serine/threonine-protein kinase
VSGYQVMEYLGSGARSTTWRVRHNATGKVYALKRTTKQPGDDTRYLEQAMNEFQLAQRFDHPAVRKYFKLKKGRRLFRLNEIYLFMEMCEGASCQANRPTDVGKVALIFEAVAEGLAHMHAHGFVHCDMKPNNVIVAPDGTVKVIDFGQSCRIGTVKERIQGTPDFISPEQVNRRPVDARTDIFNFGATLYWTLTGTPIPTIMPKQSESVQLLQDLRVTPVDQINSAVPPALARLVLDCIEMTPARRPANAKDVAAKLDLIAHQLKRANGTAKG